jgi:ribonuclease HII
MLIGVDEAGRGPLAGPVAAAAVMLNPLAPIAGLADSKTLSARQRERLALEIRSRSRAFAVGFASVEEIDELNILRATFLAMTRAVEGCLHALNPSGSIALDELLIQVDGNRSPADFQGPWHWPYATETIVKGDQKVAAISAASILAKTARDEVMRRIHEEYPQYGFDRHAGYGTALHLEAIRNHGVLSVHRKTFAPIAHKLAESAA